MRILLAALLLLTTFAGCLADDPAPTDTPDEPAPAGDPVAIGTYYAIGDGTFEPTIGTTSTGGIFMTAFAGLGAGTAVRRSMDNGATWDDATPTLPTGMKAIPNSNDPFLYVDPWTDRIYDFDMCITLSGFCVAYSDDDGESWLTTSIATGYGPALDHQSLAAAPAAEGETLGYPNFLTWCVNRGPTVAGSWCSSSLDGGITWTPLVPGFPVATPQCSGLSGHVTGSEEGIFYRGNPACDGPAVYKSLDGGLTWSEHVIPGAPASLGHEIAVAADALGGVYAFWIAAEDGLPYLAVSTDRAETWSEPMAVGADMVTAAGFPTIAAAAPGHIAFAYIGTHAEGGYDADDAAMQWHGYIGYSLDAGSPNGTTITTIAVNSEDDPLDDGVACGRIRCGGFGDFIDIVIDQTGRPWAALAHNGHDNAGIVGTFAEGPSLWGNGTLTPLPLGGAKQW